VFHGTNKLTAFEPLYDATFTAGEWKYYWYVSTQAMDLEDLTDSFKSYWQNEIGLGIKTVGADVDLYVTVMDGRYPTEHDYDFKSTNQGSDWVTLSSN